MKRRRVLLAVVVVGLLAAGGASAIALRTITLRPGQCRTVKGVRVCASKPRVVVRTVTVAPSPIGKTFSGNGTKTLEPITLTHGVTAHWTAKPDAYGYNLFSVSSSPSDKTYVSFDNGSNSTSGSSYIPPGTYTLEVIASGAWTLSF
jgi:hypothetical protein